MACLRKGEKEKEVSVMRSWNMAREELNSKIKYSNKVLRRNLNPIMGKSVLMRINVR